MDFNLTIFVQVINFFVTYAFLKKFLFAPVITQLTKKNKARIKLIHQIDKEKEKLLSKEEEKNERTRQFKQTIKNQYAPPHLLPPKVNEGVSYELSPEEVKKAAKEAKKRIIERALRVD